MSDVSFKDFPKSLKRAERRRRTQKKKNKSRKIINEMGLDSSKKTCRMFNNMQKCSCHMCCNVRRSNAPKKERLTRAELRQIEDLNSFNKWGE